MPLLILFVSIGGMKEKKEIVSEDRRTGDLTGMVDFLEPFARKMLGKKAFAEADVLSRWSEVVGEETASYSKPVKIDFKKMKEYRAFWLLRWPAAPLL